MAELRQSHPDKEVELWCEDEARLGLKPVVRRVWALAGTRPTSNGRHKFESLFVYGFAHPASGRGRFLILPKANSECMGQALSDFAGWADPDGRKVLVVIVDGSGGHTAKGLRVPPNVVLHRQPSCTPELQPASNRGRLSAKALPTGCSTDWRRRRQGWMPEASGLTDNPPAS